MNLLQAQWIQTNGPFGNPQAQCFATGGSYIYAGVANYGVYRSMDTGGTWEAVNTGLSNYSILSLASSGPNVFVGTFQGVFLSTDDGASWSSASKGLMLNAPIYGLASIDSILLAGTVNEGIFRSTNNGTTWAHVDSGPTNSYVTSFAKLNNTIFASASGGGLLRSMDYGMTWIQSDSGITNGFGQFVFVKDGIVFVGTLNGLYMSSDNGSSWNESGPGVNGKPLSSFAIVDSNIFIGITNGNGVFSSSDNGTSWKPVPPAGLIDMTIFALVTCGENLFASTSDGVFTYKNNGATWTPANLHVTTPIVNSLSVDSRNLYATTDAGIFRSIDGGGSWTTLNNGLTTYVTSTFIASDTLLIAATANGPFRSTDGGLNWMHVDTSLSYIPNAFAVIDTCFFAGVSANFVRSGGIYISTNSGRSWVLRSSSINVSAFAVISNGLGGTGLFGGTYSGVFRSMDNGASWVSLNSGLTDISVDALISNDKNLYAGTTNGNVFLSTDEGVTWNSIGTSLPRLPVRSLAANDNIIVAGTDDGAYGSTDRGITWIALNLGNWGDQAVQTVVIQDSLVFGALSGTPFIGSGVWRCLTSKLVTGVDERNNRILSNFNLLQNFPNPFNPTTVITYQLPMNTLVTLKVYDALGRLVRTLVNENQTAGTHSVTFNASNLSSGVYFYRLSAGNFVSTKKLMLIK